MDKIKTIEKILARERKARKASEKSLEDFSYKFYKLNESLKNANEALEEEVEQKTKKLQALNAFSSRLQRHVDLETVLAEIIETVINRFNFEDCIIYLVDHESGYLIQHQAYGLKRDDSGSIISPIKIPLGEGIVGQVAVSGEARLIADTTKTPEYIVDDKFRYSELSVPILDSGKVIGVIDSEHSQKDFFTAEHLETLITISNLSSTHLQNAISLQKQEITEKALQESQERYKIIIESASEYIVELDQKGYITYANPYVLNKLEYTKDEFMRSFFLNYVHDDFKENLTNTINARIEHKINKSNFEFIAVGKKNNNIWVSANVTSQYKETAEGSKIQNFFIVARDITETKTYERILNAQKEKYSSIIANMNLGLLEVNLEESILFANQSFTDMSGYSYDDLIGRNASDLFASAHSKKVIRTHNKKRAHGISDSYELSILNKKGEVRIWLISGAPNYNMNNEIIGSIGIHLDITEQKRLQNDLEISQKEAERARDFEKEFLANMSHEIRNPLNSVIGMTNLLYDTELSEEQREYLESIKFSNDLLKALVSDILDMSKIIEGKMELSPQNFNLYDTFIGHKNTIKHKLKGSTVNFASTFDQKIPHYLFGDLTYLNQILVNVLSNAMKFTKEGQIEFKVQLISLIDNIASVKFIINDSGIGIEKAKLTTVFKRFSQAGKVDSNKENGTGLGLYITKKLSEIMGGGIHLESTKGVGSKFEIIIPFEVAKQQDKTRNFQSLEPLHKELCALIVEDNRVNRKYIEAVLKKSEISYVSSANGKEAIQILADRQFDFILMDIRMPEMDGYETTLWIRSQHSNINTNIPIIALTASALLDEKEKAIEVGANYHLSKPFTPEQLVGAIAEVLKKHDGKIDLSSNSVYLPLKANLNFHEIHDLYGDDFKHVLEMFEIFLEIIPGELEKMNNLLETEDWNGMKQLAHKIKPNFKMVGLGHIEKYASDLEHFDEHLNRPDVHKINNQFNTLINEGLPEVRRAMDELVLYIK